TAMGDTVNLASRLEGQTKTHGISTIIGSRTAAAVIDEFALIEIESIRVKGKNDPEVIYTIVGRAEVAKSAEFAALRDHWARRLAEAGVRTRHPHLRPNWAHDSFGACGSSPGAPCASSSRGAGDTRTGRRSKPRWTLGSMKSKRRGGPARPTLSVATRPPASFR